MLAEAARAAASTVVAALQRASAATGTDFNYLLGTAIRESGLKPHAKSSSSSAAGLFQFVEQTWYSMIKEFGAKHGLTSYANAIHRGDDGRYRAKDPADRQAILRLRNDPQISALMAGEYARQTQTSMQGRLGRDVSSGELYAAHLFGTGGACRLIRMNESSPAAAACDLMPRAANANRNIFFRADGTPKTVREVYDWTVSRPATPAMKFGSVADVPSVTTGVLDTADTAQLLASMWSPRRKDYFSSGDSSMPQPFSLTPAILDVLSVAKEKGSK